MKVKVFSNALGYYNRIEKDINDFIRDKHLIDIKVQTDYAAENMNVSGGMTAIVMYEDKSTVKTKIFSEFDYPMAKIQDAVNAFCKEHEVVSVSTNEDSDGNYLITVTYKEKLND
ncbi:MAG: hypothetical protein HDR41_04265 [Lactobacillus sp.]|nr:hypothetical protein [Lactobacillus sp.]